MCEHGINIGTRFTLQRKSATKSVNDWETGISKSKRETFIVYDELKKQEYQPL
jgi:hypothetical protein